LIVLAAITGIAVIALIISSVFGGDKRSLVSTTNDNSTETQKTGNNTSGNTGGSPPDGTTGEQTILTYWGLWEQTTVLEEIIKDFETKNPGVKIDYRKQSHLDYRERLQTAIASGNGPDLFRFHASWTPMLSAELAPLPNKIMTPDEYQKTFYPVAARQLQNQGQLVGIPLMYDGLSLYYNKEILR